MSIEVLNPDTPGTNGAHQAGAARDAAAERLRELRAWLATVAPAEEGGLQPLAGDASARRYFRLRSGGRDCVAMDAPPGLLDCRPFLAIATRFRELGLNVPEVLAAAPERGFVLLSDLGRRHYLDALSADTADALYGDAFEALLNIQLRADPLAAELPDYDDALIRRELQIFVDWLLQRHLGLAPDAAEIAALQPVFATLSEAMREQPRCWVHRDYHSRNLLVTPNANPGILDFQDGLHGPVCYDPVSLLRDCYIDWPQQRVGTWALDYFARLRAAGFAPLAEPLAQPRTLLRWFDLTGVQRHLKAAGLFARLYHRDAKPRYLADLPRTLGYVVEVCGRHAELYGLRRLLLVHAARLLR